jgi:hypothetical protein
LEVESTNSSTKTLPNPATGLPMLPSSLISSTPETGLPVIYSPGRSEGESLAEAILAEMGF